jgi:hypothetical protein
MLPRASGRSQAFGDALYLHPLFSAEVKDMIGSSQSELAEVLRKGDLVALREMLTGNRNLGTEIGIKP